MKISQRQLKEVVRRITEAADSSYVRALQDHVNYLYQSTRISDAITVYHKPHVVELIRDVNGDQDTVGEFYSQEEFASGLSHEEVEGSFLHSDCEKAYIEVRDEFVAGGLEKPGLTVINYAMLHDDDLWGRGIGKLAYQQLIHDAGKDGNVIVPHWCSHGGTTSNQARRLWEKLRSGYQTTGPILIPDNLYL